MSEIITIEEQWHWNCPHCGRNVFAVERAVVDWRVIGIVDVTMMRAINHVISAQRHHGQ